VCGYAAGVEFRFCPECGARAGPVVRERRKVVTLVFCDVVGYTALGEELDPEALGELQGRYFDRMRSAVEGHGGTVDKFIGDAVMAVFGLPVLHEDDALRALRAAVEMRAALSVLGLEGRIGVNSGEVVTGTTDRLATGDPVNVAARLQQSARPGEILLGETTLRLAGDAVEVTPLEPFVLKGKRERVSAWRLLSVSTPSDRPRDRPLVGRAQELQTLRERGSTSKACRDASWSRSLAQRGSASPVSSLSSWTKPARTWFAAAVSPTARGSRTGRWSRW